nr:MAG TPA: hypothetical protein [Caudoviricetes sp.]
MGVERYSRTIYTILIHLSIYNITIKLLFFW